MVDRHTLLVSYRTERGEQRGPIRKGQGWEGRGDCIDCKACVAVCPMGIDIRDGAQLECIQCALCIDACDEIMDKIRRPRGLIAYDTIARQEAKTAGITHEPLRLLRPRTLLYSGLIALVAAVMVLGMAYRTTLEVNVLHDRGVLFVPLSDGGVRNGYTVKVLNKRHDAVDVVFALDGLPGARMAIIGQDTAGESTRIPPDNLRELRVLVTVPPGSVAALTPPSTRFDLIVKDVATGEEMRREAIFQSAAAPRRH